MGCCLRRLFALLLFSFFPHSMALGLDFQSCTLPSGGPLPSAPDQIMNESQRLAERLRPGAAPVILVIDHPHPAAHSVPPYHRALRSTCKTLPSQRSPRAAVVLGCPNDTAQLDRLGAIILSTGLVAQLETPEELTFVIAHEIAHSILHAHRQSALLGRSSAPHSHSPLEEVLADQLALELLDQDRRSPVALAAHELLVRLAGREVARPLLDERLAALASHWS